MNCLYRISFNRAWPVVNEASRKLFFSGHVAVSEIKRTRSCLYCKKYGLYDDEEEESFGEYNRRGAYIDHRSNKLERQRNSGYDPECDDMYKDESGPISHRYVSERKNRSQKPNGFYRHPYGGNRTQWADRYERKPSPFYQHHGGNISRAQTFNATNQPPIQKNFYVEHSDVAKRSKEEVDEYRKSLNMTLRGNNIPNPITKFSELCVPDSLLQLLNEQNFPNPTAIQSQGWPIALSGRDMIGISQTGSGKTLVFALPAMVHIMNQPRPESRPYECAPQALVLAPTRELAQQIHVVSSKFRHSCGIQSSCVYGGASKGPQLAKMIGTQMCIATPGRLIDFLNEGSVNLNFCSYLVLDEADRMLDMGFEPQIRQIIDHIRPDRQTLMWSATWPEEVQTLAMDFLEDYIQVTIGSEELSANPNIEQNVYVMSYQQKNERLFSLLNDIKRRGNSKVLVFAQTKRAVDLLAQRLNHHGILAMAIHGDVSQQRRDRVLSTFRTQPSVLIATDVAARGLDVSDIHHVINYDFPTNIEDYIHRIGRTARGSKSGIAHSFFTYEDASLTRDLINVMEKAGQIPSPELLNLLKTSNRGKGHSYYGRSGYQRHAFQR